MIKNSRILPHYMNIRVDIYKVTINKAIIIKQTLFRPHEFVLIKVS